MRYLLTALIFLTGCVPQQNVGGVVEDTAIIETIKPEMTIEEKLVSKTAEEKANIKADEIVKQDFSRAVVKGNLEIEIQSVEKIEGGVQVLARAYRNGQPIGFGEDGSVEIERFKIYNPPILVEDPLGTIIRQDTDREGVVHTTTYREDPTEALKQTLEHIITLVGKNSDKVISGKVGNTTSTFYPDASVESTSVDGYSGVTIGVDTFAGYRNSADGNDTSDSGTLAYVTYLDQNNTNQVTYYIRSFFLFDTSAIPDADIISSATLSIFGQGTTDATVAGDVEIVETSPASNTAIVDADYDQVVRVALATAINVSSWSNSAYNDFTLNASGVTAISKTGVTKLGSILSHDLDNTTPSGAGSTRAFGYFADQTGTTNDPMMVVVHGAASSCTAPATGNWNILAKDNCYVTTDTYVQGKCVLLNTEGPGALYIIDGARLACHGLESTSTPVHAESGTFIDLDNS